MKCVRLFELTSIRYNQNKVRLVVMLIVAPLFWYINVMHNEETTSGHPNLFSLKLHNGVWIKYLILGKQRSPAFFHIYAFIKNWKKNASYGDDVIPSISVSLSVRE